MALVKRWIFLISILSILIPVEAQSDRGYAGADKCGKCHPEIYNQWKASGHARILREPSDPELKDLPLPGGYQRKDISYVIGGYKWKALYLDKDGYLIDRQYNLRSGRWAPYFPGERFSYDCGGCHTTGFDPQGRRKDLKGIEGNWQLEGVECEACHGPGAFHAASALKSEILIDRGCSRCHGTKPYDLIPVAGVFIAPYTEENQFQKSKMRDLGCTGCHDPHKSARASIKQPCEACHAEVTNKYKESYLYEAGVSCTDCHMPPAVALAEGEADSFRGDFKSHLFRIDHTKKTPYGVCIHRVFLCGPVAFFCDVLEELALAGKEQEKDDRHPQACRMDHVCGICVHFHHVHLLSFSAGQPCKGT